MKIYKPQSAIPSVPEMKHRAVNPRENKKKNIQGESQGPLCMKVLLNLFEELEVLAIARSQLNSTFFYPGPFEIILSSVGLSGGRVALYISPQTGLSHWYF